MDNIWAPWRIKYVTKIVKDKKGCTFCRIFKEKKDKKNFVLLRSKHSYSVLNIFPYNNGHILIVPNRHVNDLGKMKREERDDLFDLMQFMKETLDKNICPKGYNIGMNLGRVSGAGYPGHLHVHIVPRWTGDMNFMPVISDTKVISVSLRALYDKLVKNVKKKRN